MRDLVALVLHLLATVARLAGPGEVRAVVAESVLVKQQLLILNPRDPTTLVGAAFIFATVSALAGWLRIPRVTDRSG